MTRYRIDFRLIQKYGLSLNEKKRYFMIFDPQTWDLMAVFDNLNLQNQAPIRIIYVKNILII